MKRTIPPTAYRKLDLFLGKDGKRFFHLLKLITGTVSPVIKRKHFVHAVHFREGMTVRNWMRAQDEFKDWHCHDLDDSWAYMINRMVMLNKMKKKYHKQDCPICQAKGKVMHCATDFDVEHKGIGDCPACQGEGQLIFPAYLTKGEVRVLFNQMQKRYSDEYCAV